MSKELIYELAQLAQQSVYRTQSRLLDMERNVVRCFPY